MEYRTLYNGVKIPEIGYGTYKTPAGEVCVEGVKKALETGYRLIDTAAFYANEGSVKDGIIASNVCRNDIFITTKLWNSDHGYENTLKAFDLSMNKLGLDVLDLYLIHWPKPLALRDNWQDSLLDTWRAFEKLYDCGAVRAIGVCNCQVSHLEYLLSVCRVKPMVNQIEMHVGYPEAETVEFCKKNDILVEAWAPIAKARALDLTEIVKIAADCNKTPAQIFIKWCMQKGVVPLPKSVTDSRIIENFDVFDFSLSELQMKVLDSITAIGRLGSHPDECNF